MRIPAQGQPVFAERQRLTELKRRTENRLSTRKHFNIPAYTQRNVGSVECLGRVPWASA